MKIMKKLLALVMALTLVMGTAAAAAATSDEGDLAHNFGSITITGGEPTTEYSIYRIFDLASFSDSASGEGGTGHYVYRVRQPNTSLTDPTAKAEDDAKVAAWKAFVNSAGIKDVYLKVNEENHEYVTWVGKSVADFAKLAIQYAEKNNIAPDATAKYTLDGEGKITAPAKAENLRLGYYLIDSTQGTLCNLTSTNLDVTINDKNPPHKQDKYVIEDNGGKQAKENNADYNQNVHFETEVTLRKGADNVVYHDSMSANLKFVEGSIHVYAGLHGQKELTKGTHYRVDESPVEHDHNGNNENCTFRVVFEQSYLDTITGDTALTICYDATLEPTAVINIPETNDSIISYGKNNWTESSHTNTYTFGFKVFKYEKVGNNKSALADAEFVLQNKGSSEYNGKYAVWAKQDNNVDAEGKVLNAVYKFVKWTDSMDDDTLEEGQQIKIVTDASGAFALEGLDADSYDLIETLAPDGYERLAAPINVRINDAGELYVSDEVKELVEVLNNAGSILPSTGGNGVYFYYVLGTILMLGAAVLLITKRRMSVN